MRLRTPSLVAILLAVLSSVSAVAELIGGKFTNPDGTISKEIMSDFVHLTPKGFEIWAAAIESKLAELLGDSPIQAAVIDAQDLAKPSPPIHYSGWLTRARWHNRHQRFVDRAKQGNIDLLFLGDSITQGWEDKEGWSTPGKSVWAVYYTQRNAAGFGSGGDIVQNLHWRITHGEIDGIAPKVVVLMIGTNNFGLYKDSPQDVARGIEAVVKTLREKLPNSHVLLLGIFPRGEKPGTDFRNRIRAANELVSKFADGRHVHYMDIGGKFTNPDGTISKEIMPEFLHLTTKGYEIWAAAIESKLAELLGEK